MTNPRLRTASILIGVPIIATIVGLAAAEGTLRLAGVESFIPDESELITEYDSVLGWRKKPLASRTYRTSEFTVTETTNSRGLRGPEYAFEKPADTYRILLLGDSFAEGYTTGLDSTAGRVLERLLDSDGKKRSEVINGGTAGYSTDQELLFFREAGRMYKPDLTVLLFYANDVWFNSSGRYWRGSKPFFVRHGDSLRLENVPVPKPDPAEFAFAAGPAKGPGAVVRNGDAWLSRNSRLYGLARTAISRSPFLSGIAMRMGFAEVPNEWRSWKRSPDSALAEAWKTTEVLLTQLNREVAESGGRLVIFYVPSRPAVYADDWTTTKRKYAMTDRLWSPTRDAEILTEICRRASLDCIDSVERFRVEAARMRPLGKRLYFNQDAHWNADGHRLAGTLMAEHVRKLLSAP